MADDAVAIQAAQRQQERDDLLKKLESENQHLQGEVAELKQQQHTSLKRTRADPPWWLRWAQEECAKKPRLLAADLLVSMRAMTAPAGDASPTS